MNTCDYCSASFQPTRPAQRFCKTACRSAFHREQKQAPVEIQGHPVEQTRYRCTGCLALWVMADRPKYCPGCGRSVKE